MSLLGAFGVMAFVVVAVIAFSGAFYTSHSSSPGNEFSADAVDVQLASTGSILNGADLAPGVTRSGSQTVTNAEHRASVRLSVVGLPGTNALGDVLRLTVRQTQPNLATPVYEGKLKNLTDVGLGTFASAEQRTFSFELVWPAAQNSPSLQGSTASFSFEWLAVSVS